VRQQQRITVAAAAASLLTSTALAPLLSGALWFAAASGAVLAVAAAGALARRRRLPVLACVAAGLAGLVLYLNLIFETAHSLLSVVPTAGSLSRLLALARAGVAEADRWHSPAPALPSLVLLAAGGVGVIAALTDLIAARLRLTALAGLPLLVLLVVPVTMNACHDPVVDGLAFCLAATGYLALLAVGGRGRPRGPRLAVAAPAGLASVLLAVCAPLLAPRLDLSSLFASDAGAGGIPQTTAELHDHPPLVVFRYTTTASPSLQQGDPQYFRQYVYDTLGPAGWQPASYPPGAASADSIPPPPGLTNQSASQQVTTTVTTTRNFPDAEPVSLPLPYPAVRVTAPGQLLVQPDLTVSSAGGSLADRTYTVVSDAVNPSPAQLEAAPAPSGMAAPAPDRQLPSGYRTTALEQLAEQETAGQATEYGKVNALADWLSSSVFRYSLSAPQYDSPAGLASFLTSTRTGYCVQFAYAMTVLTRLLGIPARLVTGYTAGTQVGADRYVVKTTDAHAWAEVYFPTVGWIRFEPTPGGQDGTARAPDYMTASGAAASQSPTPTIAAAQADLHASVTAPPHRPPALRPAAVSPGRATRATPSDGVLSVLAVALLALLAPAVIRRVRRAWRWSQAAGDAVRAHVAWTEFRDDLADFGLRARPGEPPRTLANRISAELAEPARSAVGRLAVAEERARYDRRPCASTSTSLRRDGITARRGLDRIASRGGRWRARVFPVSLFHRRHGHDRRPQ
jgi:transglutaminase-like putative cysteine protease